jgi:hypothetical protein
MLNGFLINKEEACNRESFAVDLMANNIIDFN